MLLRPHFRTASSRLKFNSVINMEIFRLIFITLLITCSVVVGYSDCEKETSSKLPDDQCLSDLDESASVITTATEEAKILELFAEKTTTSTTLDEFDDSINSHNNHGTEENNADHPTQFELQENNIKSPSKINTPVTTPLSQSDSEEDMTHEEISTHPITLESVMPSEEYTTTEDQRKVTSELYSNRELLFEEINTESLKYQLTSLDDLQENSTVENGAESSKIVDESPKHQSILEGDHEGSINDENEVEAERFINNEGDMVMNISTEKPGNQHAVSFQEIVFNLSNGELEKPLEHSNNSKFDESIKLTSSLKSIGFDSLENEGPIDNSHYIVSIFNGNTTVIKDNNLADDILENTSNDEGKYKSTNNTSDMDDEVFSSYSFTKQADYILHYSRNKPPQASELSSRNIGNVMMNDEFIHSRNGPIEQYQNQKVEQGANEPCTGCDLGILPVTTAAGNKGKIENSPFRQSHAIPEASIQFADVPPEKDLRVDDLGLAEGSFLFSYLGELLSWLQPNDFPVELMRNALRNQISIIDLITQSLKLEAGFIGCIAIGVSLALAAPIVVLAHTCYRIRRKGDEGDQTPIGCAGNCRRRTLVFFLQIIIFLLLIGTAAMLITNQQVSTAVLQTGDVLKTVLDDLNTFLQNVHHQLHFVVSKHLDQAVQAVNSDLDNVEILLGQPIQTELSKETGLDVALESLRDISQDVSKVGESVELVQLAAGLLSEGIIMTTDKLSDLRLQVNSFRRQCSPKDRPLCDTLNIAGLEVTFRVDSLRQDENLRRVRQIGGPELRGAVESARALFRDIPRQVEADTKDSREAVRRQLNQEQMHIDENIVSLDILVRNLKGKLTTGQNMLDDVAIDIPELEFWRWIIGLGAAGSLALLWILLQLGISCGCCGSEKSAGPTLLICVILICLLSTVLWLLAIIVFLIGGHGQAFICRPLYQEPEFPALSQLLDDPGLFPSSHKFISTLAFNNDTIDVPFNKVLRECHENKPIYPVFKLNGVFNIETMTEPKKWDKFHDKLNDIKVKLNHLKVLSPTLQNQLNDLLQGLSVNLTAHRTYLSSPVTGKDLNSFAAQLESVGNQIKDLATASRMETLASRTRRLIATHIEPLKEKKNNLLYQLTTLEVQLNPLQRQVEQSISHFKTIQFFIDSQGNSIAGKKVKEYTHRLRRYMDQYKKNLSDRINNNLARCQPLWKLFNTSRLMLCKHVMDPLNGFWFSTVCCLIILLCATPVCLKLVDCYKKKSQVTNYTSGSPTENLMSSEHGREWSSNGTNDSGGGW